MIEPKNVIIPVIAPDTICELGIVVQTHSLPVVNRHSPKLAVGGEIVWWYTRHSQQVARWIYREELTVCPHVGRVVVHVKGKVSHDPDAPLVTILSETLPLTIEDELIPGKFVEPFLEFFLQGDQCVGITVPNLSGPLVPRYAWITLSRYLEQSEIPQPV